MYGEGISREGEVIDLAVKLDIIKKSGSWYSYQDNRIGQGRDKVKQYLKDNPEFCEKIAQEVMAQKDKLLSMSKGGAKKKGKEDADADTSVPTAAPVDRDEMPMDDEAPVSSMPDLDEDFGGQRSSSSKIIDIEADDK